MKSPEYCPNCADYLVKDSKQLGYLKIWLVCPTCGYRKRPTSEFDSEINYESFSEYKNIINNNLMNQYEQEHEGSYS